MKKFISMVMAAAMVVSLVPATAFAATGEISGRSKIVDAIEEVEDFTNLGTTAGHMTVANAAELQIKLTDDVIVKNTNGNQFKAEIELTLDNADFAGTHGTKVEDMAAGVARDFFKALVKLNNNALAAGAGATAFAAKTGVSVEVKDFDNTSVTYVLSGTIVNPSVPAATELQDDDILSFDLASIMDNTNAGATAAVSVDTEIEGASADDLVFASVLDEGLKVTLKKVADVGEEEETVLESDLKIEKTVGTFVANQVIVLDLNSGFEWKAGTQSMTGATYVGIDDDELTIAAVGDNDEIVIDKAAFKIDAVDAKAGDVATITVKAKENGVANDFKATAEAVEAAKVVGEVVTISVDEDEDVPVIYSGVNVNNYGITDDSDHMSLEVTLEESVVGAFDWKKEFTLTLPEGVFVTDVKETGNKNAALETVSGSNEVDAFAVAYEEGEYENFTFERKTFKETTTNAIEYSFEMELIAVPGFEGDVTLTLDGDAFDEPQEVVIAKFVAPYTVEAASNDLVIDYRNTEIPTSIVVKEAEAGLWDKDEMEFTFGIEKFGNNDFEDDAVYTVNEESEMEVDPENDGLAFGIDEESDDEAAVVTISNISLYMNRNLPAGAYDLELGTSAAVAMMTGLEDGVDKAEFAELFTTEEGATSTTHLASTIKTSSAKAYFVADVADWDVDSGEFVAERATVKEGFVNIITAGRDQDDASFTKKVVVPVGELYIIAGEEQIALDVPAYVSAEGYTMLPVRAVATALGISNENVLWNQASKQVTILYGQRIITMTAGQKVVTVNGSTIPASAAVEIVDGRTFLPMRDLATALGVTDITWDQDTKTATLNGSK